MTKRIDTWSQYRSSRLADKDGLLLPQEEFFLGRMVHSGSEPDVKRATDELLKHNQRLISTIAKRFKGRGCTHEDMMTDGMLGLLHAIERYDPTKGYRFSTYATNWIRQAIGRGVENRGREIRLPSHIIAKISHIRIARQAYIAKHGQTPSMPDLLKWIHSRIHEFPQYLRHQLLTLDVQYLSDIVAMERVDIKSLDEPNVYGQSFSEYVANQTPQPGDGLDRATVYAQLYKLMQHLTDREMACIRLRYGFDDLVDGRSLEDVGLLVGYSRERIRQIQCRALTKLRELPEAAVLFETLEGMEL